MENGPGRRPGGRPGAGDGTEGATAATPLRHAGIGLVEVLIALAILSVGLLSIAGIAMSVGAQTRLSTWQTDQALAAQVVLERVHNAGYDAATDGTDTVYIGSKRYIANRSVTVVEARVKEVRVTVSSQYDVVPRAFTTRLHQARQLPPPPSP